MTLAILAAVVACVSWTVTQEEVFREPRDYCKHLSFACKYLLHRKFFYLFTCEYCFSHYVATVVVLLAQPKLFVNGLLGVVLYIFTLVAIANVFMSLFRLLRLTIKLVGNQAKIVEANAKLAQYQLPQHLRDN